MRRYVEKEIQKARIHLVYAGYLIPPQYSYTKWAPTVKGVKANLQNLDVKEIYVEAKKGKREKRRMKDIDWEPLFEQLCNWTLHNMAKIERKS